MVCNSIGIEEVLNHIFDNAGSVEDGFQKVWKAYVV